MNKKWVRTKLVQGRLNPFLTLSDCGNYTKFLLKISLFLKATAPTGGSLAQ